MNYYLKVSIEGIVIFSSVLASFFLNNRNEVSKDIDVKNQYVGDLVMILEEDINQMESLMTILFESEELINEIQNDIDAGHTLLSDREAVDKLLGIEVGTSFFTNDGVFTQMIATGSLDLVSNKTLVENLLEMYNHNKDRNTAISVEIDQFNREFKYSVLSKFRIRFEYNLLEGEFYGTRKLTSYNFDESYYLSNELYGLLSQAKTYSNMYKRHLSDIKALYNESKLLAENEL
ncbi:MAG TPA: hypothetical protein DEF03_04410 [Bacteroidetes bacterium]|nr:hypothetical protein [Bacteroidota bacterium]|tara:strand:+ start:1911 stop:2609 length:699 start_codon:yes stop_codon:yes gene_type:complete